MWQIADKLIQSRFLLGTAQYPSMKIMQDAIIASATNIITVSLKRHLFGENKENQFWHNLKNLNCHILPNTAGCRHVQEAVTIAEMAREIFHTDWIKLEIIGDDYTLQPNPFELIKAATILTQKGFEVFPYCTEDLIVCKQLIDSGCRTLMPWAAPIGSGKGVINPYGLAMLRDRFQDVPIIIDAGIGKPSHATQIMEMGFDGLLLNSAVSLAQDPIKMAIAFKEAIIAGRHGFEAGLIPERNLAQPSTSLIDTPFWQQEKIHE